MKLTYRGSLLAVILFGCSVQSQAAANNIDYQRDADKDRIIVQCSADCAAAEVDLAKLGATINKRYDNVAALAVTLPLGQMKVLSTLPSIKDVAKSRIVKLPGHRMIEGRPMRLTLSALKDIRPVILKEQALQAAIAKQPLDFGFDNALTKATVLHKEGKTGKGIIVALIDTGTANNAEVVPALAGSVVGGETLVNFVDPVTEPSATSTLNDSHGTMTGTMMCIGKVVACMIGKYL